MENQNETLEKENIITEDNIETQKIISLNKFIILTVLTLGLYGLWWNYKS